jgi:hypothetical protein
MALLLEHRRQLLPHSGHEPSHKNAAHHEHDPRLHGHDPRLASPPPPLHTSHMRPPVRTSSPLHRTITASPPRSHFAGAFSAPSTTPMLHSTNQIPTIPAPTRFRDLPASRIHSSPLRYNPTFTH